MAAVCRVSLSCLWLFLMVLGSLIFVSDLDGNRDLLFAPGRLWDSGGSQPILLSTWRRLSYLAPSSKYRSSLLPAHFWLLLLAGDIEANPGPIKYPCTACGKSVRKNQRGILCDRCDKWTHASCCGVNKAEYQRLGDSDEQWICPGCLRAELPYADCSLDSAIDTNSDLVEPCNISQDEHSAVSPLETFSKSAALCHLNIQSLMSKRDELKLTLTNAQCPVILGLS